MMKQSSKHGNIEKISRYALICFVASSLLFLGKVLNIMAHYSTIHSCAMIECCYFSINEKLKEKEAKKKREKAEKQTKIKEEKKNKTG